MGICGSSGCTETSSAPRLFHNDAVQTEVQTKVQTEVQTALPPSAEPVTRQHQLRSFEMVGVLADWDSADSHAAGSADGTGTGTGTGKTSITKV
jgi:hypothetical protein